MQIVHPNPFSSIARDHEGSDYFELYRCDDSNEKVLFSARATSAGKPVLIFEAETSEHPVAEFRISNGFLVNGKTNILDLKTEESLGCYTRIGRMYDRNETKVGRWRDEFKENLVDAIGNTLLGCGDVLGGANLSNTHLFSNETEVLATLTV